jgi:hypothetical protein
MVGQGKSWQAIFATFQRMHKTKKNAKQLCNVSLT